MHAQMHIILPPQYEYNHISYHSSRKKKREYTLESPIADNTQWNQSVIQYHRYNDDDDDTI